MGLAVAQLVKAVRYKPKGRGFDSPIVSLEFFNDIILPVAICPWGLTEMSTKDIFWGVQIMK